MISGSRYHFISLVRAESRPVNSVRRESIVHIHQARNLGELMDNFSRLLLHVGGFSAPSQFIFQSKVKDKDSQGCDGEF